MATTNSQLVQNLQNIYNEKLLIKQAIPTTSDNFMDYHTYISALHPSGTSYITTNGEHDVSSYQYAYVTVEGGGSSSEIIDPLNAPNIATIIFDEEDLTQEFPYVNCNVDDNFSYTSVSDTCFIEWDTFISVEQGDSQIAHFYIETEEVDEYWSTIYQNFQDWPELYDSAVYPCLKNVTITESADPSEDGYDYLVEGELYAFNLGNNNAEVNEITENGFYITNSGAMGIYINVIPEEEPGGGEEPEPDPDPDPEEPGE